MTAKKAINSVCENIFAEIDKNGFLDHEIRAVEKLVSARESTASKTVRYKIFKHQSNFIKKNCGSAFIQKNNSAVINYSSDGSRLEKILAIGHELGHIALKHVKPTVPIITKNIKDVKLETDATYFALKIATRRAGQYGNEEFYRSRYFPERDIEDAIYQMGMVYNENELERECKNEE